MNLLKNDDELYHYLYLLGDDKSNVDPTTVYNLVKLIGRGNYNVHKIIKSKQFFKSELLSDIQRLSRNWCATAVEISVLKSIVNEEIRN